MGNRLLTFLALVPCLVAARCQGGAADERPCQRACARLEQLGCPEGAPTPEGAPCSAWMCSGGPIAHNPTCIAAAPSCEAARECAEQ